MKVESYYLEKDNKKICFFGVSDNYVWFKKTEYTKNYKIYILRNVKQVFKDLLTNNNYLYTFSLDNPILNKWHEYVGMKLEDKFTLKNKNYNIWVNK